MSKPETFCTLYHDTKTYLNDYRRTSGMISFFLPRTPTAWWQRPRETEIIFGLHLKRVPYTKIVSIAPRWNSNLLVCRKQNKEEKEGSKQSGENVLCSWMKNVLYSKASPAILPKITYVCFANPAFPGSEVQYTLFSNCHNEMESFQLSSLRY